MTMKERLHTLAAMLAVATALCVAGPAVAGDIIADWNKAKTPKAPELKKVTVSAKDTAVVSMDLQSTSCVHGKRERCVDTIPHVKDLLTRARAKGMLVVHTHTSSATPEKILKEVAPKKGEPIFSSSVDKFYDTGLTKLLKDKGIKTVILVGTSAEGTVIGSATGGAIRGFKVIVPVDGMSSNNPYAEQYVAWHLVHSPGTRRAATLTRIGMIEIK